MLDIGHVLPVNRLCSKYVDSHLVFQKVSITSLYGAFAHVNFIKTCVYIAACMYNNGECSYV